MHEMDKGHREIVIGYDAKEVWLNPSLSWGDDRRFVYLLNESVHKPLSVDTAVWASIYDGECDGIEWAHPEMPDWLDIWPSLLDMEASLQEFGVRNLGKYWMVAITCLGNVCEKLNWRKSNEDMVSPNNEWQFLGYDIADSVFTSGLSNCGYINGEQKYTSQGLNEHHLFINVEDALRFKEYSDRRVKEHAPFYVYGLYLISECNSA